jgi:hypothetical protein
MNLVLAIVAVAAIALAALACSDDDKSDPPTGTPAAPSPSPGTPPPSPPGEESPSPVPGGVTGIPAVDRFLDIRNRGDVEALRDLVRFTDVPCKAPTDYWLECPAGQPEGTLVSGWPWWGCHGAFSNRGTPEQIAEFFSDRPGELTKVLTFVPARSLDVFPPQATVAVVLQSPADEQAWAAVLDDDGNFYGVVSGCPANAAELVALHFGGAQVAFAP